MIKKIGRIISFFTFLCLLVFTLTFNNTKTSSVSASMVEEIKETDIKCFKDEQAIKYVIPGGDAIGLKFGTGVYLVGKYQVQTESGKVSPWKNSNLENGDKIVSLDNYPIENNEDLLNLIAKTPKNSVCLGIVRGSLSFSTNVDVVVAKNGDQTIGLYIKDRLVGIGTITFIDPVSKIYASLGHGISDNGIGYGNVHGECVSASIESIKKAVPGTSGEKRAALGNNRKGNVLYNSQTGVYGVFDNLGTYEVMRVAKQSEVVKGPAVIKTVLNDEKVETFNIEIINVIAQSSSNTKGIKLKITDERLLEKTGGIVQGMSGSPIIQNGMIVGAVSHVSIDDPLIGYAMHIEWMIEDINNNVNFH